ncbi:MAG: recombinase family protein [Lachnospiraceae bacterium]|nr:recombinase family protein [Lachnospiraceae bacterium]
MIVAGVAKYLNSHGYVKKLRQNNTIPGFSRDFVKNVLDNPVYIGKIAYGRRRTEKKMGTRNEMHVVEQSEFPVYEGQHEAIISEEDWNLAQEKRRANSYRREKVNDPNHAHILSGILKCPCCGKSMYGNIAKAHSKDKKTRYYYYCKNTVTPIGHECTFRVNIEQTELNQMVAKIISAMVRDPRFSEAIKEKIGTAVDTADLEKQLDTLQAQLRQAMGTKSRLERQMDTLDVTDPYYDRKTLDLQRRYDEQYGRIEEIEIQMEEVQGQIRTIRQEKISGDNIYRLLLAFDEVYHSATEAEQKEFMKAFIERIELFPEKQKDGNWIRKIVFAFPVPVNGKEVKELPLENETMLETVCLLSKLNTKQHIEIDLDMDELDLTDAEKKATYQEIKDYGLEHIGLKVSSLYIAQVKQKCGIIERENYNKSKSEDAKQPQCPPEKEKAIMEALKHFGMI